MFRIANRAGVLGLAGAVSMIALAEGAAQQPYDYGSVVYEAARNKIGLMRYCRNNALLSVGIADKAAEAVRFSLLKIAFGTALAKEMGDRAENAGENGFWQASRRHDMASIAKMFGTTPAGLCREWAQETLRTLQPGQPRDAVPVAFVQPPRVSPPAPQPPHAIEQRRVTAPRQAPKTSDTPPMPAKAVAVPAKAVAVPARVVAAPAKVVAPEVTNAPAAPEREEPTVNWGTGPIIMWTTVRVPARPASEPTGGTVAQKPKGAD